VGHITTFKSPNNGIEFQDDRRKKHGAIPVCLMQLVAAMLGTDADALSVWLSVHD